MKRFSLLFVSLLAATFLASGCCSKGSCSGKNTSAKIELDTATPILGGVTVGGFTWKSGVWPTAGTEVKLDRTPDGYFLAEFTCFHRKDLKLQLKGSKVKNDDMNLFAGECVELFLSPDPAKKIYYQIAVSPTGAVYTAKGRDITWNSPGLKKKIEFFPGYYKITLKVPFKDLGVKTPADGTIWKANFCRTHHGKGFREASNWAGSGNYHDLDTFGKIAFSPKGSSASITLDSFQSRSGVIQFKLELRKMDAPMEVWVKRKDVVRKAGIIPMGKNSMGFLVKMPDSYMPIKYEDKVLILVKNAKNQRPVFVKELKTTNNLPDFLVLDKFYYIAGDKVHFQVQPPDTAAVKSVTALLLSNEKTIRKKIFKGDKGFFDTKGMKSGRYVLKVTDGKNLTSRIFFLREKNYAPKGLPANKPLVPKAGLPGMPGVLTCGGKEVFLIGASTSHNGASYIQPNCFNLSYGAKYAASPYALISGTPGKRLIRNPETAYLYPSMERFLDLLLDHMGKRNEMIPSINRLTYEAQLPAYFPGKGKGKIVKDDTFAVHKKMYDTIKAKYPNHIISLQTERFDTIPSFIHSCDVLEIVPGGSYNVVSMEGLPKGIRNVANACAPAARPVILWIGVTIPNNVCRRVEEVRATAYLSVMYGISGMIFHMGHDAMPKSNTRMWNFLSQILGEVQGFQPEFVAMKPVKEKELLEVAGKDFVYKVRAKGNKAMALFVNESAAENKVTFRAKKGYKFACGKKEFTMILTPYETLVLRMQKAR